MKMRPNLQIAGKGFMQSLCAGCVVEGYVMLEAVTANPRQQAFQLRHLNDRTTADGIKRIVHGDALSHISFDFPPQIVGAQSEEGDVARFTSAMNGTTGIFVADALTNNIGGSHCGVLQRGCGKVATVKQHTFIWIVAVVIIPVGNGGRTQAATGKGNKMRFNSDDEASIWSPRLIPRALVMPNTPAAFGGVKTIQQGYWRWRHRSRHTP